MLLLETNKKIETSDENDIMWCEFASCCDDYMYVNQWETGNWRLTLCSVYDVQFTQFERYYE